MADFCYAHDISHFQCRLFRRCPRLGPRRSGDFRVYLAERVRLEHARDMIGGVTGLVVTLVALVLGLLIWTAFGVFSTQKAELQGIAANALEFNQETREYGPEAAHARALMRADLDYAHRQLWGDDQTKAAAIAASIRNMDSLSVVLDHIEPTTDAQKSLLADAKHNYEAIWQSRILMSLQGVDAVSGQSCTSFPRGLASPSF